MANLNALGALFNNRFMSESEGDLVSSLHNRDEQRLTHLRINWDFYEGRHPAYFRRMEAEDNQRFQQRQSKAFVDNFCRAVVDKSVSYLYGQGHKIIRRFSDPKVSKFMKANYDFNDIPNFMINASTMGGVEGNALVKNVFVDSRTVEGFKPEATPAEIKEYGRVRHVLISGLRYVPIYPVYDYTRLTGIVLQYEEDNYSGSQELEVLLGKKFERKEVLEYISDTEWLRWERIPAKSNDWKQVSTNPGTEYENKNPYGSLAVVFTEFENLPLPNCHEGLSDIDDVVNLNLQLDERQTDLSYTIIHHIWPMLVLTGAQLGEFKRTPKSVLEIPAGASADYLTWDNKIEAALKFIGELKQSISRLSSIPAISWGELGDIGNLRSGAALRVAFAPAIEKTQRKQKTYGRGEKQLAMGTLKMYEFHTGTKFTDYEMELKYPDDFVPTDELNDAQIMTMLINSGVLLRKDVIAKLYPDLDEAGITEKQTKITAELEKFKEVTAKISELPVATSEKKSIEQE